MSDFLSPGDVAETIQSLRVEWQNGLPECKELSRALERLDEAGLYAAKAAERVEGVGE